MAALATAGAAGNRRPLVVVDSHDPRPWAPLQPDLVTPNAQEAARLLDVRLPEGPDRADTVTGQAPALLAATGAAAVVVTLDRDGTVLHQARRRRPTARGHVRLPRSRPPGPATPSWRR